LLLTPSLLWAESRYVTDTINFSLREAPNRGAKFMAGIRSGTKVEVLETHGETGYTKVKTEDGKVGYIETRRLQSRPTANVLLEEANSKLEERNQHAGSTPVSGGKLEALQFEIDRLKGENRRLNNELTGIKRTAANALNIALERDNLRKELADMTRLQAETNQEREDAVTSREQRWFIIGAGVIVGGILLGLFLPHVNVKRQKGYPGL
jgi:SH3 domain protein